MPPLIDVTDQGTPVRLLGLDDIVYVDVTRVHANASVIRHLVRYGNSATTIGIPVTSRYLGRQDFVVYCRALRLQVYHNFRIL